MTQTQEFQNQIAEKMTLYFKIKLQKLSRCNPELFKKLEREYYRQLDNIKFQYPHKTSGFRDKFSVCDVLINAVSEPRTCYKIDDFSNNGDQNNNIYSPRIDIAFSPVISKVRGRNESIGIYKLTKDVQLFKYLHRLEFIKEIELRLRIKSNENMRTNGLDECIIGLHEHYDSEYLNERPLHLFGIEIENQKNSKHLMGDFLNALSLSRVPIVVVPENKLHDLINMLKFSYTIFDIKRVPIYSLLNKVDVLTVRQFREVMNYFLHSESLELIDESNYN